MDPKTIKENIKTVGQKHNYVKSDNPLISIYRHTIEYCCKQKFNVYEPIKYDLTSQNFFIENILDKIIPFDKPAIVLVENIDSFDMARNINNVDSKVMVLNLASEVRSGGGVARGTRAQEEDLYRKSNYFEANSQQLYPLQLSEVIYSPLVYIIKDRTYKLLPMSHPVSCLAVAALKNPKLKKIENDCQIYKYDEDYQIMERKIDMIFKVAILHGHTNIVLGALGCGVYHNPPLLVAQMFKNSVMKYGRYFKKIGFAILSGAQNTNFDIFKNVITGITI